MMENVPFNNCSKSKISLTCCKIHLLLSCHGYKGADLVAIATLYVHQCVWQG